MRINLSIVAGAAAFTWLSGSHVPASAQAPSPARAGQAEDFVVVDCLLPGQVRQLGQRTVYLSARRPARLSTLECRIRGGEYVAYDRADAATALAVWRPLAEQGDAEAQLLVGEIHERGLGVPIDYPAAAAWYRRAAERGNVRAQINLGHLLEKGLGVDADLAAALDWYRRAAGLPAGIELDTQAPAPIDRRGEVLRLEQLLAARDLEIRRLGATLDELRGAATADRSARDTERTTRERELAELRAERARLMADLDQARHQAAAQRQELTNLQSQSRTQAEQLAVLRRPIEQKMLAGPAIALVDPPLVSTRDIVRVATVVGTERAIVGRVTAPAGLLSLTINDRAIEANEQGVFSERISLAGSESAVHIAAVDRQGKRAELRFRLQAPTATAAPAVIDPPAQAPRIDFGRYHALVVGINDYPSLPRLTTPVADARAIAELLQSRYGFQVTLLTNPTRYQLLSALNKLRETLTAEDNLLVYYAGHGELDEVNQRGNWLPLDAERDNTANWIPTTVVTDILNIMRAKQVLVVSDSCYSGALTRSSVGRLRTGMTTAERGFWLKTMSRKRARLVLSSGGLAPVMDQGGGAHSVFAKAFLDVLAANRELLDGQRLHREVAARVAYAAANQQFEQVPEYAPIRFAGHEAGEFFLVPKP